MAKNLFVLDAIFGHFMRDHPDLSLTVKPDSVRAAKVTNLFGAMSNKGIFVHSISIRGSYVVTFVD